MVSPVTCHVLDTTKGKPASNIRCEISYLTTSETPDQAQPFAFAFTNEDGRVPGWTATGKGPKFVNEENDWHDFPGGRYRIRFHTKEYFLKRDGTTFFPFVDIWFEVPRVPEKHYHVPLLLSNYGYSTYRGS